MQFREIVAPSMKELFVSNMESMILSGQLKIGEKLPPERDLAAQMKISRTIVNSGFVELSKKGFIEIHPRQGVYVADYITYGNLETLLSIINFNGGRLDRDTFASICEFRRTMEGQVYALAAQNRTQEDLEILFGYLQKIKKYNSIYELSEDIYKFHHAIFCATKNVIYPLVHNGFGETSRMIYRMIFDSTSPNFAVEGIEALYMKIKDKDSEGAKTWIVNLIDRGVGYLNESVFKDFPIVQ